VLRMLK